MARVRLTGVAKLQPAVVLVAANGPARGGGRSGRPQLREAGSVVPALSVADPQVRSAVSASIHIPAPDVAPVKLRNVVGILRGSDPALKDTYLMLTAHYDHLGVRDNGTPDHIYNGADDDASGTASLIEIASALAALPTRPRRSIVFIALFGEELGDLGSHYYAIHPIFPLTKTVADINLEQLGRTDDTEEPHVHMFNLTGYDFTDLPAVFDKAGAQTGIKAVKNEKNSDAYFTRSDNAAFAEAGVPSTTLSVAYNFPDYHQPGDEWQKLDYDNMALVDRTIALALLDLANSTETTKWNQANPKTEAFVKARELSLNADKL
jgi:Zn-dependent M28 family amino/carboxypeptidase